MGRMVVVGLVLIAAGCGGPSTDDWVHQIKDAEVVKRRQAIRELGARTGDAQRVVPALMDALHDENGYVRRDAARALGKFGAEARDAAPALLRALKDSEPTVRAAAGEALKKIEPAAAAAAGVR